MKDRKKDQIQSPRPSVVPVKCAVCNGFGTLKFGALKCHGCEGKGYILVPAVKEDKS